MVERYDLRRHILSFIFSPMDVASQLPGGHKYCKACMAQLREKRVAQTYPLCRKPLPSGPHELYDLGYRLLVKIMAVVEPDWAASWEHISSTPAQQRGMDQSRALMLEAAAQGQMYAQVPFGVWQKTSAFRVCTSRRLRNWGIT